MQETASCHSKIPKDVDMLLTCCIIGVKFQAMITDTV